MTRHAVHAPVAFNDGCYGMTTDISSTGVRFEYDGRLAIGTELEFQISLGESNVLLHCVGRVVRVESTREKTFVAATIYNVEFDSPGMDH